MTNTHVHVYRSRGASVCVCVCVFVCVRVCVCMCVCVCVCVCESLPMHQFEAFPSSQQLRMLLSQNFLHRVFLNIRDTCAVYIIHILYRCMHALLDGLTLNRPMGCTGIEGGLLTTTTSSSTCRISTGESITCNSTIHMYTV